MSPPADTGLQTLQTGDADEWVRGLFSRIDAKDTDGWLEYLSDDARFCFGNSPPVSGRGAIREAVSGFFSTLSAVNHSIAETWTPAGSVICRGQVTYTRLDGSTLTIPFANVLKLDGSGLIGEYIIYADVSRL